jgi:preprotein translocase subunit SecG
MIPVLIGIGTFLLIIVAVLLVGAVLLQRAKSDSGMAAMGGGMVESAFGPDTSNVLSKFTIRATIVFFLLSFLLYLGYVRVRSHGVGGKSVLPNIAGPSALPRVPAGMPSPSAAQPASPVVSIPSASAPAVATPAATTAAPDAANKTSSSSAASKAP